MRRQKLHYLKSVEKYFNADTCQLIGTMKGVQAPNFNNIQSIHEVQDSWFELLSDYDFGTIDNAINNL